MGDDHRTWSAADRTSSWASADLATTSGKPHASPKRALPPRQPWAAYVLIGVLIIAVVTAGVVIGRHIGGSPTSGGTAPSSQETTVNPQSPSSTEYSPDTFSAPVFGAPLRLTTTDSPSWTVIEDAQWESIGLAYVKADQMTPGGSIIGVDLANNEVLWRWDLGNAVDDSGTAIASPTLGEFGDGYMGEQEQTLFSGQSHNYFVPNGQGRFAVFIQESQDGFIAKETPTTIYVFSVADGSVISHTTSDFGPCNKPEYVGDVVLPGAGFFDTQLGGIADTGGVLWATDFPSTSDSGFPTGGQYFFGNEAMTVSDKWVQTPEGYVDIHSGEPAPFGQDVPSAKYYSVGDSLLRVSSRSELQLWDPQTNTPLWDPSTTIPGEFIVGGDDQAIFINDEQRIKGYAIKDGSLLWQSTAAPPNAGSVLHVGNVYLTPMSPGGVIQHWASILSFDSSAQTPQFCFGDYDQCQMLAGERVVLSLGKERLLRAFDMTRNHPTGDTLWTLQISQTSTVTVVAGYFLMISDHATITIGQ